MNIMIKIFSINQDELKNIMYAVIDASGIKYEKGDNTIKFDSLINRQ